MASESDLLWIRQIRQGDAAAWEQLIHRYEGRILAFAMRRIHDRAASEDIVQETFIGFLNSLPNYDESRELQTYLFTIAAYKITDHIRRVTRRPMQTGEVAEDFMKEKWDEHQRPASSMARSKEQRDLESAALGRALAQLIAHFREKNEYLRIKVLELLFVKAMPNKDVAKLLNLTEQQIANYRFAAIRKLSEQLRSAGLPENLFPELEKND